MAVRKLLWLGSRLLGYGGRRVERRDEPDGTVLEETTLSDMPVFQGCAVRRIRYASDGLAVTGYIFHPRSHPGALPVLLYARGGLGPHGTLEDEDFDLICDLASRGPFLVLATEYRGNVGGEGEDRAGEAESRDLANLLLIARELEEAEPERAVGLGFSRGGTMALMAIRSGMRLRALATIGCVVDLAQAFEQGDLLLRGAIRVSTGGRPGERRREEYAARSPLLWADAVDVPLLLLHGEEDETIHVSQSRRMAEELERLGHPHELVLFPGGNHKLLTHREERSALLLEWYSRHLGQDPG